MDKAEGRIRRLRIVQIALKMAQQILRLPGTQLVLTLNIEECRVWAKADIALFRTELERSTAIMNPAKIVRDKVRRFTDLPNIGPAGAKDFELLGFKEPSDLVGADPLKLFDALCAATGSRQDPCVLDVLMSVTHFLDGGEPEPWWHFTEQRKRQYGHLESVSGQPMRAASYKKPAQSTVPQCKI